MTMSIKDLNKALRQVGQDFGLDGEGMVRYAREDKIPGLDKGNQYGAAYTIEGKFLYALIRELKPESSLEIGVFRGGRTCHIAAALKANGRGHLTGLDIWNGAGLNIPKTLRQYVTTIIENVDYFIERYKKASLSVIEDSDMHLRTLPLFDFVFEDGSHSEHQVHNVYLSLPYILKPGGFIVSHDTATGVGQAIRNGMVKGGAKLEAVRFYDDLFPLGYSMYKFMGYQND